MGKIKQLPDHEAQKIAAGQVIDRPAHVVKELIENALDAGATKIHLSIEDGGKQLITLIDNGCGMSSDDAQLCFAKHATSKISCVDELISITTYGFRGEALASIAAVSAVELRTKQKNDTEGTRISFVNNQPVAQPIACPNGTEIIVRNLFYNMPAREKFLKKRETETRHITQMVQAITFAHPELHVIFEVDGNTIYNCPPQESIKDRFAQLWDHNTAQHMMQLDAMHDTQKFSITGAISNHQWFRYDRSSIYFLVNNRWVMNHSLARALLKGYNNVLPQGKYPMACIAIYINPAHVDINMHPRKEEVKFAHPRLIEKLVEDTVRATLEKNLSVQIKKEVSFITHTPYTHAPTFSYRPASFTTIDRQPARSVYTAESRIDAFFNESINTQTMPLLPATPQQVIPILEEKKDYRIIGQYHKTYIIIDQEDGLFMIDQHAAHERVLYELFANRFNEVATINLMFPQLITLTPDELALIEPHLDIFKQNGISIERFSADQLIIQSTPVHVKNSPLDELVRQVISWIKETNDLDAVDFTQSVNNKLRAQMACKAAVKAGDELSREQMQELLDDLYKTPNRFSCPHGRPTGWLMSLHEIEKQFRRKL